MTTNHVTDISEFTFSSREEAEIAYSAYFDDHVARMEADIASSWIECHAYSTPWMNKGGHVFELRQVLTFENGKQVQNKLVTRWLDDSFRGDYRKGQIDAVDGTLAGLTEENVHSIITDLARTPTVYWRNTITGEKTYANPCK